MGNSSVSTWPVPTQYGTDNDWDKIALFYHVLALKTNGTLWAWGGAFAGETGHDPTSSYDSSSPLQILGSWLTMAAGFRMSFGIKTDGTLWAWGQNDVGQLGNGTTTNTYIPVQVGTATNWQSVACGYQHAVALRTDGSLWAWGQNNHGQLGNNSVTPSTTPVNVPVTGCTLANEEFVTLKNALIISPNPANNELTIHYKGNENITLAAIYDINGKEVFKIEALGNDDFSSTFNIAMLQSGTYILSLKNANKTIESKQFVKN